MFSQICLEVSFHCRLLITVIILIIVISGVTGRIWGFLLQLKTQLTETLGKLETEESERQKVAADLYKVRWMLVCETAVILLFWLVHLNFLFPICVTGTAVSGADPGGNLEGDRPS